MCNTMTSQLFNTLGLKVPKTLNTIHSLLGMFNDNNGLNLMFQTIDVMKRVS